MLYKVKNSTIAVIGDPHFGKKFLNGVDLSRRGEREQSQYEDFRNQMTDIGEARTVIVMGDLFDQFRIEIDTLCSVTAIICQAAVSHPDVDYFILQGNHDITRNKETWSSFDLAERMCGFADNIHFVKEIEYHSTSDGSDTLMLIPYDAFTSAADLVSAQKFWKLNEIAAAFGHWDIEDFGHTHNLIPLKELGSMVTDHIFTGHIHTPSEFSHEGDNGPIKVTVVGSLQPYTHGEDPTEKYYVTRTLAQYEAAIAADPLAFHNKVLRLYLKDDEQVPDNVDALQFSFKYVDKDNQEEVEVKTETFSFRGLFDESMTENEVPPDVAQGIWNRYEEIASDAANT